MHLVKRVELGNLVVAKANQVGSLHPGEDDNIEQLGHLAGEPYAVNDTP